MLSQQCKNIHQNTRLSRNEALKNKKNQSLIAVPLTQAPATQQPFPPTAAPTTSTTEPCKYKVNHSVLRTCNDIY